MDHAHRPRTALSRRSLLRAAGLGGLAVGGGSLLAACGSDSTNTAADASDAPGRFGPLALQLSWIKNHEFTGEYMAIEQGHFTDAGFSGVDLLAGGTATTAESIVLAGKATVGLSSTPITAATILNSGAPLKIIGATYQKNPFAIVSLGSGKPITNPQDMVGKKIGVQSGGNQTLFDGLLAANEIDASEVEIVGVQYDNSVLREGGVDGFMTYVTGDIALSAAGFDPIILGFADNGLPFVAETFTVLQDTIDSQREMLKAFLVAEVKGWTDAILDPATSAAWAVQKYGADQDLVFADEYASNVGLNSLLVVTDETNANGLFTMSDQLVADNLASLSTMGYDIEAEQLFDLSLIQEVFEEDPDLARVIEAPTDRTAPEEPQVA